MAASLKIDHCKFIEKCKLRIENLAPERSA
jgi:hypothetical protein